MEGEIFELIISESYDPQTLPMARLAEYLMVLASLFGEKDHVHFKGIKKGSSKIEATVENPVVPKVRERLRLAISEDAPKELSRSRKEMNLMLAHDNAKADLRAKVGNKVGPVIIRFPGKDIPTPIEITEFGELKGRVIRVGGIGQDATLSLQLPNTENVTILIKPDMAKQIAPLLYEWILLKGTGKWRREEDEGWQLQRFRANEFKKIKEELLYDTISSLQNTEGSKWSELDDPQSDIADLRSGD